jgi:prepilin-type N-terminal cleavage/methylation domain-containing protein
MAALSRLATTARPCPARSRRPAGGFTALELAVCLLLLAILASYAASRMVLLSEDAEAAVFQRHLMQARSAIHATRVQASMKAGMGAFTVGGCQGQIDRQGNGIGCLNDGQPVKVAHYNLTCLSGLSQVTWFKTGSHVQGQQASDEPGKTMTLLTTKAVAGARCVLTCTNGIDLDTPTALVLRPDLAAAADADTACPASLDPGG